jgi:Xaa-Pro aminopeptidase
MNLEAIQEALREQQLNGWLFYDHHHRDAIAYRILGLDETMHVTRRWYYFIPASGTPRKLTHRVESGRLDSLPGSRGLYSSWQELQGGLNAMLDGFERIAMQYSHNNDIMYISMVDAGTVELLREMGKEIVSSADLVSQFEAVLSDDQIASHYVAQRTIDAVLAGGFAEVRDRLRPPSGRRSTITEYELVIWLQEAMRREGLTWENGPNVSVNQNCSDSHYEPTADRCKFIRDGDFLLIDIWGRTNQPGSCYYDITWTGTVGREPSELENEVFYVVRQARDAAIEAVREAFSMLRPIHGYEADDAARKVIAQAGYGEYFTHRTGHNISTELHGNGAHLDNLETHDERLILPYTCFSVEPGIYLREFGIRSEINMITSRENAQVTGRIQTELVYI